MASDIAMAVEIDLDDLPLVLPQRLGNLRIVLLRQHNDDDEDGWELEYSTVGVDGRDLWVEARDEARNEYTVRTRWTSGGGEVAQGTYKFTPRLASAARSLTLLFSLEESEHPKVEVTPHQVATHWAERLSAQLVGWASRESLIETILRSSSRREAIEGITSPPLELSEAQAMHVLDLPLGRLTGQGQEELIQDLESVRSHLQT